jgi:hypothetical protein
LTDVAPPASAKDRNFCDLQSWPPATTTTAATAAGRDVGWQLRVRSGHLCQHLVKVVIIIGADSSCLGTLYLALILRHACQDTRCVSHLQIMSFKKTNSVENNASFLQTNK